MYHEALPRTVPSANMLLQFDTDSRHWYLLSSSQDSCCHAEADKQSLADVAQQMQQSLQQDAQERHVLLQDKQAAVTGTQNLHDKVQQQQIDLKRNAVTIKQLQDAAADLADELQAARSALCTFASKCEGANWVSPTLAPSESRTAEKL